MPAWVLPAFLFFVWCWWAVAATVRQAALDARRGLPEGRRGGMSILPVIPLLPLWMWGIAWTFDRIARPWGTILVGVLHLVFAIGLFVSLVRDWLFLRSIDGST
jgi:hypothetical protein